MTALVGLYAILFTLKISSLHALLRIKTKINELNFLINNFIEVIFSVKLAEQLEVMDVLYKDNIAFKCEWGEKEHKRI